MKNTTLPANIAELIRKNLRRDDKTQVCLGFGIKDRIIRAVLYDGYSVKPKHIPALQELKSRAISNAQQSYNDIELLKKFEI